MGNEEISTCAGADARSARPRLAGRDREIALQAIAALAKGTPVEAAYQILAGIEALDGGPESPLVMLWPKGDGYETLEDKAAWHEAERDRLLVRADEFQRVLKLARQRSETTRTGCAPEDPEGSEGLLSRPVAQECFAHQKARAGEPSARGEADPVARHPPAGEPLRGASDE